MQAIIFADRFGQELEPINQSYCPALLPLAGKPIIFHALESMQIAGVDSVILVLGPLEKKIKKLLDNGCRWSLKIQYLYRKSGESYLDVLKKCEKRLEYPLIATRGDVINKHWLSVNQKTAKASIGRVIFNDLTDIDELRWSRITAEIEKLSLDDLDFYPLLSLSEYHSQMLAAIEKLNHNPVQNGDSPNQHLRFGTQVSMQHRSLISGQIYVDDYSEISADASIEGPCYIGRNCIIDKGALVKNSIILDNTFVGAGMQIENAIVSKNSIARTDLDCHLLVTDTNHLSSTKTKRQTPYWQRLVALFFSVVTLPLMFFQIVFLLICGYRMSALTTRSNRDRMTPAGLVPKLIGLPQMNKKSVFCNRLILLFWVIKGDLRLFGRDCFYQASENSWQKTFNQIPKGLFSLAQNLNLAETQRLQYELMEVERFSQAAGSFFSLKWIETYQCWYFYSRQKTIDGTIAIGNVLAQKTSDNMAGK